MIQLERLLSRLPTEAADAVVGMVRPKSSDLARHLRERLGAPAGEDGSFLSEPYLEGAFPWLSADGGWDGLDPGLLHPHQGPPGHRDRGVQVLTKTEALAVQVQSPHA